MSRILKYGLQVNLKKQNLYKFIIKENTIEINVFVFIKVRYKNDFVGDSSCNKQHKLYRIIRDSISMSKVFSIQNMME